MSRSSQDAMAELEDYWKIVSRVVEREVPVLALARVFAG
jgi:hypothetical protein